MGLGQSETNGASRVGTSFKRPAAPVRASPGVVSREVLSIDVVPIGGARKMSAGRSVRPLLGHHSTRQGGRMSGMGIDRRRFLKQAGVVGLGGMTAAGIYPFLEAKWCRLVRRTIT